MKKRSIVISGHSTSISLEDEFWDGLAEIAKEKAIPIRKLLEEIDAQRDTANLSSAIRLYVLGYYQKR